MSISCANCGAEVPEGASICDNCGMPVSERELPKETSARETPSPSTPAVSSSPEEKPPLQGASARREGPPAKDSNPPAAPVPPPPGPPPLTIPAPERQPAPGPSRRGERPRGRTVVLGGVLGAALLAVGVAVWFLAPRFVGGGDSLEVPSLEGRTLEEARRLVGGDFEIVGDGGKRGVVKSQDPAPGKQARRGARISVVLTGAETVTVPDVVGRTRAEAEEVLRSEGFEVGVEGAESGEVLEQSPSGGEAERGSTVTVTVGEAGPAPGYTLVSDDTGALTMELPDDWVVVTGPESEVGGPSWSSFLGETVGTTVTASPNFDAWYGAPVATGIYAVASRTLAEGYTNEDLVVTGPSDFSPICTLGDAKDFERPPYQARIQAWKDCNGDPQSYLLAVAIAPEDRECVIVMQIGTTSQADRDTAQRIIDTVEVDCGSIAGSVSTELADASEGAQEPDGSG